jgi:hypothetical protein
MTDRTIQVRHAIQDVIDAQGAALVAHYYDEEGPFAGRLFDELPNNDPARFTPEDLVAASLLDVRFDPRAVRGLLIEPSALNELLSALGHDRPLWETEDLTTANELWRALREVPVGRTRTSKLLARKRPRMLPILDSVISQHLCLEGARDRWALLRDALRDPALRDAIDSMAPPKGSQPSTLRLLDVAVWMRHSESKNARHVRHKLGLPVKDRR